MRYACRAAVVAGLVANTDLTGVQVEHCWPGNQQKPESIWLNPTEGVVVDIPVFRGPASVSNPIVIDDTFTIPIEIMVSKRTAATTAPADAETRLGVLQRAVIATFTADPGLTNVSAPAGWQIIAAVISEIHGPGTARGNEGAQSYASVVLHIHARKS